MHEITETVTLSPELQGQFTDIRVISKGQVAPQGVGGKLMCHRTGELILPLREKIILQSIDPSEAVSYTHLTLPTILRV